MEEKSEASCAALISENLKCAKFLLDTGIDVNFRYFKGETLLTFATLYDQYSLMQNGVSIYGSGALHFSRSKECTELLICEGADVNLKNCNYNDRHAHKRLFTVLPIYSKIQVLPDTTSCRLMKTINQQLI